MNMELMNLGKKNISLRGLWKGFVIKDEDVDEAKFVWAEGLKTNKYFESDPLRGDHTYEVSKSSADLISTAYYKTYNLPVVITRFGNIYGEGDLNFSRIIPGIMEAVVRSKKLEVRSKRSWRKK